MSRPKFANAGTTVPRRPKQTETIKDLGPDSKEITGATAAYDAADFTEEKSPSITDFMQQQMQIKNREPTRAITLRFEESLWQRVEILRGNLSKNDFFRELVLYYDKHAR